MQALFQGMVFLPPLEAGLSLFSFGQRRRQPSGRINYVDFRRNFLDFSFCGLPSGAAEKHESAGSVGGILEKQLFSHLIEAVFVSGKLSENDQLKARELAEAMGAEVPDWVLMIGDYERPEFPGALAIEEPLNQALLIRAVRIEFSDWTKEMAMKGWKEFEDVYSEKV